MTALPCSVLLFCTAAWVKELKASGVLVPVQKFSKFLHGMALLYPEQVARNPSWFTWDEAAGCAAPASLDEARAMAEERSAMKQQVGAALFGLACSGTWLVEHALLFLFFLLSSLLNAWPGPLTAQAVYAEGAMFVHKRWC